MLQRTIITLLLLAAAFFLILFREALFPAFILLAGLVAQWEMYSAFRRGGYRPTIWTGMIFAGGLYPFYTYWGLEGVLCVYLVLNAENLVWAVFMPQRQLKDTMASIFAMFYPGWCMLTMVIINARGQELADIGMTLVLLIPCVNDIFAYLSGRFFGKTPLAPKISPKKTVEGALGALHVACW